jgi:hypothetical protein
MVGCSYSAPIAARLTREGNSLVPLPSAETLEQRDEQPPSVAREKDNDINGVSL